MWSTEYAVTKQIKKYCFNVCWAGSAVFFPQCPDGLTYLAGERPVVDDEQARVAETLKKLHRGDMDIVAYEDEHKFDGNGNEPA